MKKPYIHDVVEQVVVFDGKPNFIPTSAALFLINHYAYSSMQEAKDDEVLDPKKYRVRLILEYEETK